MVRRIMICFSAIALIGVPFGTGETFARGGYYGGGWRGDGWCAGGGWYRSRYNFRTTISYGAGYRYGAGYGYRARYGYNQATAIRRPTIPAFTPRRSSALIMDRLTVTTTSPTTTGDYITHTVTWSLTQAPITAIATDR
jgi:hypothetical protein